MGRKATLNTQKAFNRRIEYTIKKNTNKKMFAYATTEHTTGGYTLYYQKLIISSYLENKLAAQREIIDVLRLLLKANIRQSKLIVNT